MTLHDQKATRQHTRDHNNRLVLRSIYDAGEISRAALSRSTHLTRTTVSDVVYELMTHGLVEEVGQGQSGIGRTPTLLRVVDDSRHIIAVDINTTELHGAIINLRGQIVRRASLPLSGLQSEAVLALLFPLIDSLVSTAWSPIIGIGISCPGLIDMPTGIVRRAVNFDWHDLPLRSMVHARYHIPVYIANDSSMAVLAEYMFGERPDATSVVAIKVGRGIGAGIVLNGQLLHSSTAGAGEIGHVVVQPGGPLCRCGNYGCLEAVANIPAIVESARSRASTDPHALLHRFAVPGEAPTIEAVVAAFRNGDASIHAIVALAGQHLAVAVANLIAILGIRRIIITGGIAVFGPFLRDAVVKEVRCRLLDDLATTAEIDVLTQGSDTVLLGAVALVITSELGLSRLLPRHAPKAEIVV
ncbi:MAG: ROK family transcriptional regulator [Herpetosiphon sp.]